MPKVCGPLHEKRFGVVKLTETGDKVYLEFIKANKHLRDEADAIQEAERLALLGDDTFVVEVKAGFGRRMAVIGLPITGDMFELKKEK